MKFNMFQTSNSTYAFERYSQSSGFHNGGNPRETSQAHPGGSRQGALEDLLLNSNISLLTPSPSIGPSTPVLPKDDNVQPGSKANVQRLHASPLGAKHRA